jgi:hypothetical protein
LLAPLADRAAPTAVARLQQAVNSPDPAQLSSAVELLQRVQAA